MNGKLSRSVRGWMPRSAPRLFDPIAYPSIIFVILLIVIGASASSAFIGVFNVSNVLIQVTPLLLISLGQMIAVGSGGLDLSVGSTASLSAVTAAVLFEVVGPQLAILAAIGVALLVGLVNGLLVAIGLEPFLVTLATLSIVQGVAFIVTPIPAGTVPEWFTGLAQLWVNIPVALPLVVIVAIGTGYFSRRTQTGTDILAVGGDPAIAKLLGVRVNWTLVKTYVLVALLAGLAGLFLVARTRTGDPTIGARFALDSLAAVVVGGTLLAGGRITVVGTVFGAFALGLVPNVMNLAGVPTFYQTASKGAILLLAIVLPIVVASFVRAQQRRGLIKVRNQVPKVLMRH